MWDPFRMASSGGSTSRTFEEEMQAIKSQRRSYCFRASVPARLRYSPSAEARKEASKRKRKEETKASKRKRMQEKQELEDDASTPLMREERLPTEERLKERLEADEAVAEGDENGGGEERIASPVASEEDPVLRSHSPNVRKIFADTSFRPFRYDYSSHPMWREQVFEIPAHVALPKASLMPTYTDGDELKFLEIGSSTSSSQCAADYPHASFEEQLNELLSRDFKELELMQKTIKVSSLQRVDKNAIFSAARTLPSYLDSYIDFARALKRRSNPAERLRLLRGFLFWIQNRDMKGAFRPWIARNSEIVVID